MIDAKNRMKHLKELGLSAGVLHLASGKEGGNMKSLFWDWGEPQSIYPEDPDVVIPQGGTDLTPLWESNATGYYAVWKRKGRLEFIKFDLEDMDKPDRYAVVAHSEQGLWAHMFSWFIETNEGEEDIQRRLEAAAKQVGFQKLAEVSAFREKHKQRMDYDDVLEEFTRKMK